MSISGSVTGVVNLVVYAQSMLNLCQPDGVQLIFKPQSTCDFNAHVFFLEEIVRKVNIILKDANSVARKEYEEKKEHQRQRKSSKVAF